MKKIISLSLFILSLAIFFWLSSYTNEWPFNYHVSEFVSYLFYWSSVLFIVSLLALTLNQKKYKIWLFVTIIYIAISVLIAWATGDGNGAIVSFDGELTTWFLIGLYSLISIIYFIAQFFKENKSN